MSEAILPVIVVAASALLVGALLRYTARRRTMRDDELDRYCRDRGFDIIRTREGLQHEIRIRGAGFELRSSKTSGYHDAATGSDSWKRETLWTSPTPADGAGAFALGSVSGGDNWEGLPPMLREAAAEKLRLETGIRFPGQALFLRAGDKRRLLLFEEAPGDAHAATGALLPLIEAWPRGDTRFFLQCDASGVRLRLDNFYLQSTDDLERTLRLGTACSGHSPTNAA